MCFRLEVLCASGSSCETCRDQTPVGVGWRQSHLSFLYDPPPGGVDWVCPRDKPWGVKISAEDMAEIKRAAEEAFQLRRDRSTWPRFARWVASAAKVGDMGLGDTVHHIVLKLGGEAGVKAFKAIYKKVTGKECGCGNRQQKLNMDFPYR